MSFNYVMNEKTPKITKKNLNNDYLSQLSLLLCLKSTIKQRIFKMYGIVLHPLVPVRAADSERSEMVTQLLFGELISITEVKDKWLFIKNATDDYCGWTDRKMIQSISDEDYALLSKSAFELLVQPLTHCRFKNTDMLLYLPAGSKIYHTNDGVRPEFLPEIYFESQNQPEIKDFHGAEIVQTTQQFLNAPYLWGGKSILGIDCSGLVQLVYSFFRFSLPRDASDQANVGEVVSFLEEAREGDLAFFVNETGKIVHVGILLGNNRIIHASGSVKIENIDANGIISNLTGQYTHRLLLIKRVIKD